MKSMFRLPLVGLVDDERVVPAQVPVAGELGQQDAVGHELDQGSSADTSVNRTL
jgi:hypothetical protein